LLRFESLVNAFPLNTNCSHPPARFRESSKAKDAGSGDLLADRAVERTEARELRRTRGGDVRAVDDDAPALGVVEAEEEGEDRALARAGRADECVRSAARDG